MILLKYISKIPFPSSTKTSRGTIFVCSEFRPVFGRHFVLVCSLCKTVIFGWWTHTSWDPGGQHMRATAIYCHLHGQTCVAIVPFYSRVKNNSPWGPARCPAWSALLPPRPGTWSRALSQCPAHSGSRWTPGSWRMPQSPHHQEWSKALHWFANCHRIGRPWTLQLANT